MCQTLSTALPPYWCPAHDFPHCGSLIVCRCLAFCFSSTALFFPPGLATVPFVFLSFCFSFFAFCFSLAVVGGPCGGSHSVRISTATALRWPCVRWLSLVVGCKPASAVNVLKCLCGFNLAEELDLVLLSSAHRPALVNLPHLVRLCFCLCGLYLPF